MSKPILTPLIPLQVPHEAMLEFLRLSEQARNSIERYLRCFNEAAREVEMKGHSRARGMARAARLFGNSPSQATLIRMWVKYRNSGGDWRILKGRFRH